MGGWIKLHRSIQDHWIWQNSKPFSEALAWIDLIMMASYSSSRFVFGNEVIDVNPGTVITSQHKLAERWGWSRKKVSSFLRKLENDGMVMISVPRNQKRTVLSIVNYSVYQDSGAKKEQVRNQSGTSIGPDMEPNLDKNGAEKEPVKEPIREPIFSNDIKLYADSWGKKGTSPGAKKEPIGNQSGTNEEPVLGPEWNLFKNKEDKNVKKEKKGDIYILSSNSPADAGEERAQSPKETVSSPQHMPTPAKKEPHTPPSPKSRDETPYTEIVAAWNEMARSHGLPTVQSLTESRKKAIRARFKDEEGDKYPDKAIEAIRTVFGRVAASDFLTGRKEGSSWRANFDWVMRPEKYVRIKEGVYDNRPEVQPQKRLPRAFESLLELAEDIENGYKGGGIFGFTRRS